MKRFLFLILAIFLFSFSDVCATDIINMQGVSAESNVKVYPNPVYTNKFQVKAEKEIREVKLTNIVGQQTKIRVVKKNPGQFEVEFTNKKQGIYLVTIKYFDNKKEVRKLIVK